MAWNAKRSFYHLAAFSSFLFIVFSASPSFLSASEQRGNPNLPQMDSVHEMNTVDLRSEFREPYARKYGITIGLQIPTGPILDFIYKPHKTFSLGMSGGGFSMALDLDPRVETQIRFLALEGKARWHVFGGAFFLGIAGGWQNLRLSGIDGYPLIAATIGRYYYTPHLGCLWIFQSGFTVGSEIGYQFPIGTADISSAGISGKSFKTLKDQSLLSLPYWTLIKLGYSF